ncbi:MAG: two-component system response regulator KdpE [Candidatus Dormibacteria bacterium]
MSDQPVVLLVEDDPIMSRFVEDALNNRGHRVALATRGEDALAYLEHGPDPDLLILDLGLPGIDGFEVLRRLRGTSTIPVLVLSARGGPDDKVRALDLGADDYLPKPFSLPELMARVRAQLRRTSYAVQRTRSVLVGDVEIDLTAQRVVREGREVRLTPTEFALLRELVFAAPGVLTHRELLKRVWGPEYAGETQYTRTFVQRLRSKLEADPANPDLILTEPGLGYRLRELDSRVEGVRRRRDS